MLLGTFYQIPIPLALQLSPAVCRPSCELVKNCDLAGIWGFPKSRGTILGVPIIRIIVFWGLYWVPLFWEPTILALGFRACASPDAKGLRA